jgi:hypothetical protein
VKISHTLLHQLRVTGVMVTGYHCPHRAQASMVLH